MSYTPVGYSGRSYLDKVTEFMTTCRQEDPLGGMWDVGDLQWCWRDDEYLDPATQMFWEDPQGKTGGFVLLSRSSRSLDYEILPRLGESPDAQEMVAWGLQRFRELAEADPSRSPHTLYMRHDHRKFRDLAHRLGYWTTGEEMVQTVLDLGAGLPESPAPAGYRVRSIQPGDLTVGKPPVLRITAAMYRRVRETSLYREDMHLVVADPDERIASECICWVDPINGIGVFEPVRTQDEFQRRGLARALMAEGLHRMAARGVRWAKVSHFRDNPAATNLYRALGFREAFVRLVYVYQRDALSGNSAR